MLSLRALRPTGLTRQIGQSAASRQALALAHSRIPFSANVWSTVRGLSHRANQITAVHVPQPKPFTRLSNESTGHFSTLFNSASRRFVFTAHKFTTTSAGQRAHLKPNMAHYEISVADGPSTASSVTSMTSTASTVSARSMSTGRGKNESETDLEQGTGPAQGEPEGKKPSRFRVLMEQYGRVAIVMYLLVSAVDLTLCVWGVWLGGDGLVYTINSYLGQYIPRLQKAAQRMEEGQSGGADKWATILLVGYAVHKCLTPLRLGITAAILPWSARTAQRLGWTWLIPKSAPTITHKPMSKAADAIRHKLK
ncbi:DUF1279 super [Coemansia sp. RSA 1807]|nr:DUF1279 super [Coemansia sp. RSA 1807]KAJ2590343.1 DUF1279 super [Coemansia sp. RSA 1797]